MFFIRSHCLTGWRIRRTHIVDFIKYFHIKSHFFQSLSISLPRSARRRQPFGTYGLCQLINTAKNSVCESPLTRRNPWKRITYDAMRPINYRINAFMLRWAADRRFLIERLSQRNRRRNKDDFYAFEVVYTWINSFLTVLYSNDPNRLAITWCFGCDTVYQGGKKQGKRAFTN